MKHMMRTTTDYLPLRATPLALICATFWVIVLAVTDYPVAEWVGVTIVAYVIQWVTTIVVLNGVIAALRWLHGYAKSVRRGMGVETPDKTKLGVIGNTIAGALLFAILLVPLGLAVILTVRVIAYMDFPPMLAAIEVVGIVMISMGASVTLTFYCLSICLLVLASRPLQQTVHVVVRDRAVNEEVVRELSVRRRTFREQVRDEYARLRELVQYNFPRVARAGG